MGKPEENFCIIRAEKLTTDGNVASATGHELRVNETKNANPDLFKNNRYFTASGEVSTDMIPTKEGREMLKRKIMYDFKKLLPEKMRGDNVTCIQLMVTYSPNAKIDSAKYFDDAEKWVKEKFGAENVFFRSEHYDETTPHCNFFIVPGYDFKYKDGHTERRLSAKRWLGGRKKMSELQDSFYEAVGKNHGLSRGVKGSKAEHEKIQKWYKKFNDFLERLNIPRQQRNESVEQYFDRLVVEFEKIKADKKDIYDTATKLKDATEFYNKYHDNLPALKKYVQTLENKEQERSADLGRG